MAKPIFCVTHPRACSTAFERVFMTRTEDLNCLHEPFGDAFYYGPERLSARYEDDIQGRNTSGFSDSTFKTIFDRIQREQTEGKRIFIKDIIHYFFSPSKTAEIAPSLCAKRRGIGTNGIEKADGAGRPPYPYGTGAEGTNPTVIPEELMRQFHFTFLIRDPHSSIPSYFRCCIPPQSHITGFHNFDPSEAGYDEVRRMFDFLVAQGHVGPKIAANSKSPSINDSTNGSDSGVEICLVDADDLLDNPEGIVREYCRSVGLDFQPSMLTWDSEESHTRAKEAFEKWRGFHDDAINSKDLKPRTHKKKQKTEEEWDAEWTAKYGEKSAKIIRDTVDANMADYLYLKQFAMSVPSSTPTTNGV